MGFPTCVTVLKILCSAQVSLHSLPASLRIDGIALGSPVAVFQPLQEKHNWKTTFPKLINKQPNRDQAADLRGAEESQQQK